MKFSLGPRTRRVAGLAVAGTVAAVAAWAFVPTDTEDLRRTPVPSVDLITTHGRTDDRRASTEAAPTAKAIDLAALERARTSGMDRVAVGRLFAQHTWQPPPPRKVAVPAPAPEPPRPPPFPFSYFGTLRDDNGLTAFFAQGQRIVAVRAGAQLGEFRIDALDAAKATVTYLPLDHSMDVPLTRAP